MNHFRFRYARVGYMRWRCRSAQRRADLVILPLVQVAPLVPSKAAWRRTLPAVTAPPKPKAALKVGDFIVGAESDPQLTGHPDIRY